MQIDGRSSEPSDVKATIVTIAAVRSISFDIFEVTVRSNLRSLLKKQAERFLEEM